MADNLPDYVDHVGLRGENRQVVLNFNGALQLVRENRRPGDLIANMERGLRMGRNAISHLISAMKRYRRDLSNLRHQNQMDEAIRLRSARENRFKVKLMFGSLIVLAFSLLGVILTSGIKTVAELKLPFPKCTTVIIGPYFDQPRTDNWKGKWAGGFVPYMIDPLFSNKEKALIISALEEASIEFCTQFVEKSTQEEYLAVVKGNYDSGCWATVGRQSGVSVLNLESPGCLFKEIVVHEAYHVLGAHHEACRGDRDHFIKINFTNIKPGHEQQFERLPTMETFNLPFDYSSIMMYGPFDFAKDPTYPTIISTTKTPVGHGYHPTDLDILKIRSAYCPEEIGAHFEKIQRNYFKLKKVVEATRPSSTHKVQAAPKYQMITETIHHEKGTPGYVPLHPRFHPIFEGDDEDMDEGDEEVGAVGGARAGPSGSPMRLITREQLAAALNSSLNSSLNSLGLGMSAAGNSLGPSATLRDLIGQRTAAAAPTSSAASNVMATGPAAAGHLQRPPAASITGPVSSPVLTTELVARAKNEALQNLPPEQRAEQFNAIRNLATQLQQSSSASNAVASTVQSNAPPPLQPNANGTAGYQEQLTQMREVGITDERLISIMALRVSDGDVATAIELIFSGWNDEGADPQLVFNISGLQMRR